MSPKGNLVTFSWDDGHPLDIKIAQMFSKYGLSCTFYIPKYNSEKLPTLSSVNVRGLSEGNFDIHSHTLNHVYLGRLPLDQQREEIQSGKKYIEDATGKEDHIFCYPGGSYTKETIDLVEGTGFTYARTIDMGYSSAYSSNNYLMPTTSIIMPLTKFQILKHSLKRKSIIRGFNLFYFNRMIINKGWKGKSDQSGSYHFWGHSWEIEKHNLWDRLEILIQSLIASDAKIVTNKEFYKQRPN